MTTEAEDQLVEALADAHAMEKQSLTTLHAAVKVDDVPVGRVDTVRLGGDGWTAEAVLEVNGDVSLPANAIANLRQSSLLGEKFVELAQPAQPGGKLGDGATGLVRKAIRTRDEREFAVKFLAPDPKYIEESVFDDVAVRFRRFHPWNGKAKSNHALSIERAKHLPAVSGARHLGPHGHRRSPLGHAPDQAAHHRARSLQRDRGGGAGRRDDDHRGSGRTQSAAGAHDPQRDQARPRPDERRRLAGERIRGAGASRRLKRDVP